MNESKPVQPTVTTGMRLRWGCPWWILGMLIPFMVCEIFFFVWAYRSAGSPDTVFRNNASLFAWGGLFFTVICFARTFHGWPLWLRIGNRCLLIFGVLVFFGHYGIWGREVVRDSVRLYMCERDMKQLWVALENYHQKYEQFPPTFVADESGQPMHSWRVLLLPFMEREDLYSKYDFDQPWNGPENQTLRGSGYLFCQCPKFLQHPRPWPTDDYRSLTSYIAVVGNDTFWKADGTSRSMSEISDPSKVPVLVDMNNTNIIWHEPRYVKLDDLLSGKVSWHEDYVHYFPSFFHRRNAFVEHEGFYHVLFADGEVRKVSCACTSDQLRSLFTIKEKPDSAIQSILADIPDPRAGFGDALFLVWLVMLFVLIFACRCTYCHVETRCR